LEDGHRRTVVIEDTLIEGKFLTSHWALRKVWEGGDLNFARERGPTVVDLSTSRVG